MASVKIILSVSALVVLLIHSGEAMQCYKCEGEPDGDCANAVVSSMEVVECPGGWQAMCHHTDVRNGDNRKFSRGCTKYAHPDLCTLLWRISAHNPTAMKVFSCKTCWEPKCNVLTTTKKE